MRPRAINQSARSLILRFELLDGLIVARFFRQLVARFHAAARAQTEKIEDRKD